MILLRAPKSRKGTPSQKEGGGEIKRLSRRGVFAFLAIVGPGLITAAADNDAGGIATYSKAGAHFGYEMLWLLLIVTFLLIIVQEMSARLGVVTQKGLGELIREEFGVKWTFFALACLFIANLFTTISEFAGISAAAGIFGIPRYIAVPICAIGIWFLVLRGSFRNVERVFLGFGLIYITYIISGVLAKPDLHGMLRGTFVPSFRPTAEFTALAIALVGTTITPWMQFFLQATVVDKGIRLKDYKYEKADVIVGSILTDVVSLFIIVATAATLYHNHIRINDAADAALALEPFAKGYATKLFAAGLLGASLLASAILPLSTAYTYCEAFGWEIGINRSFREAPAFYGIYTILIGAGACIIFVPHLNLINVMVFSQTVQGILLPVILIFMLKLINNREIMGDYVNSRFYNIAAWFTTIGVISLTAVLLITTFFPGFLVGIFH